MAHPKSYTGLKTIIVNKLADLQGGDSTDLFASVYGVNETQPAGYPVAYVIENTGDGHILDTHRNQREWQFNVIIQVQIGSNRTPEQAYAALLDAVDRVITDFDTDPTLLDDDSQTQCMYVRVVPMQFEFGIRDAGFHSAMLTVAILDVVNRYSS